MQYHKSNFGVHNDHEIDLYTLKNDHGMEVKITNYGATITSLLVPDNAGNIEDVVCGFDDFAGYFSEEYKNNAPYFGGTVGRYTSQIKGAKFILHGVEYLLAKNCGENNLHGGNRGFDKRIWIAEPFNGAREVGVEMQYYSKHLEEGYPGNVKVKVGFSLNNDNELGIRYEATTDQDTPFSITNHAYFNLSGFDKSIEDHRVQVSASKKLEIDETGAATGKVIGLGGCNDDLRTPKSIRRVHDEINDGFEHYYIFDKDISELKKVAIIRDKHKGRVLELSTSEPGMLFYTGKYTSNELQRESGQKYGRYRGFCCETHRYPNGPNIEGSPKSILTVNDTFESQTVFKFRW